MYIQYLNHKQSYIFKVRYFFLHFSLHLQGRNTGRTFVQKPEQNHFFPKKSATYKISEFPVDLFQIMSRRTL